MKFIFFGISIISQILSLNAGIPHGFVNGTKCRRECNGKPMNCYFHFRVETYYSMSKACYKCPEVLSDCYRMDCVIGGGLRRVVTVANRQLPGPSIEVCEGDNIKVLVENMLDTGESTTIHWHGLHMRETPYMDGVPFITQCPIPSRNNFTYDFIADQPGTHFWHSHVEVQRGDGLFGVLIVRQEPKNDVHHELYDLDLSEHTMIILDWSEKTRMDEHRRFGQYDRVLQGSGILINGLGPQPSPAIPNTPLANFTVQEGFTYRFRLIGSNYYSCPLEITIDHHRLIVISTDGEDIEPIIVDSILFNGGERFDFLISADRPVTNYWIKVKGHISCAGRKVFQLGILQYEGAPNELPSGPEPTYETAANMTGIILNPISKVHSKQPVFTIDQLRSMKPVEKGFDSNEYKKLFMTFDLNKVDNPKFHRTNFYGLDQIPSELHIRTGQTNHITFKPFDFAMLPDRYKINEDDFCTPESTANQDCSRNFCSCTQVLQVNLGDVVEMIFIEPADDSLVALHPIHLHGFNFRVITWLEIGENLTRADIMENYWSYPRNLQDNPPKKDTVTVPRGGITIIRFIADNPGYWFLHCHIENHASEGMSVTLKVGEHDEMVDVPKNFPTCGNFAMKPSFGRYASKTLTRLSKIFGYTLG